MAWGLLLGGLTQAQEAGGAPASLQTLHLYANLAQVPVLVLNSQFRTVPAIPANLFRLSVDSGKLFSPMRVRREGNDPLNLSIMLDLSGVPGELHDTLPEIVRSWAAESLVTHDRVSVYGLGCALVRTGTEVPGNRADLIGNAVRLALESVKMHSATGKPECVVTKRLWDTLDLMAAQMSDRTGMRVILALTDGHDGGSKWTWAEGRLRAASMATAIFAVSEPYVVEHAPSTSGSTAEDSLHLLCNLTGGLVLPGSPGSMGTELREMVKLLRDRYILEFQRPKGLEAAEHSLVVTIRKRDVLVLSAGLSMAVETADEKDPRNQPTEPIATPEIGKRRVLVPQK